ncbi:MAG: endonuclease III [Verrucomicrobia bacterium]|nr:endonuclease III [Verrucomicrobiota bacterium]
MKLKERVTAIMAKLRETYPEAHCELEFATPFQLLVATILSAQCTDKQVNLVTRNLFGSLKTAQDFASVPQEDLETVIRPTGFFRNKARNLRAMAKDLIEKHKGEVPHSMAELTSLAGVGRKTANVVLGNAFGIEEGIVVDTHVARLSKRFRFTTKTDAEKIELVLMRLIPRLDWTNVSHWMIWHGRRRCFALNPDCVHCELTGICPSEGKVGKTQKVKLPVRKKAIANKALNVEDLEEV